MRNKKVRQRKKEIVEKQKDEETNKKADIERGGEREETREQTNILRL